MRWRKRPPEDSSDDILNDARRVEQMFEAQEEAIRRALRRRRCKLAVIYLAGFVFFFGLLFLTGPFVAALAVKAGRLGWVVILLYSLGLFSPLYYIFWRWDDQIEKWLNR